MRRPGRREEGPRWLTLFAHRELRCLLVIKFLTDPVWYFYIFWIPKYLFDVRGFNIAEVGYFAWIPYAAAGCGSLFGGWLSSRLLGRGQSLDRARKITLGLGAALMPAAALVVSVPAGIAILFISLAFMGHQIWNVVVQTLPADLYPKSQVGSVAGLIGSAGAFGGMAFARPGGLDSGLVRQLRADIRHRQPAAPGVVRAHLWAIPRIRRLGV